MRTASRVVVVLLAETGELQAWKKKSNTTHQISELQDVGSEEEMADLGLGMFPVNPRKRRGGSCVGTKEQHRIGRWWRNGEARVAGNLP